MKRIVDIFNAIVIIAFFFIIGGLSIVGLINSVPLFYHMFMEHIFVGIISIVGFKTLNLYFSYQSFEYVDNYNYIIYEFNNKQLFKHLYKKSIWVEYFVMFYIISGLVYHFIIL